MFSVIGLVFMTVLAAVFIFLWWEEKNKSKTTQVSSTTRVVSQTDRSLYSSLPRKNITNKYLTQFANWQSLSSFMKDPKFDAETKNTGKHIQIKLEKVGNDKFVGLIRGDLKSVMATQKTGSQSQESMNTDISKIAKTVTANVNVKNIVNWDFRDNRMTFSVPLKMIENTEQQVKLKVDTKGLDDLNLRNDEVSRQDLSFTISANSISVQDDKGQTKTYQID